MKRTLMSETFLICKVILVCGLMEGYLYHNVHDGFEPSFLGMILAYDAMRYGSLRRTTIKTKSSDDVLPLKSSSDVLSLKSSSVALSCAFNNEGL